VSHRKEIGEVWKMLKEGRKGTERLNHGLKGRETAGWGRGVVAGTLFSLEKMGGQRTALGHLPVWISKGRNRFEGDSAEGHSSVRREGPRGGTARRGQKKKKNETPNWFYYLMPDERVLLRDRVVARAVVGHLVSKKRKDSRGLGGSRKSRTKHGENDIRRNREEKLTHCRTKGKVRTEWINKS